MGRFWGAGGLLPIQNKLSLTSLCQKKKKEMLVIIFWKNLQHIFRNNCRVGVGGQRPFRESLEIHLIWWGQASLNDTGIVMPRNTVRNMEN